MTAHPALYDDDGTVLPLGPKLSDSGEAVVFRHAERDDVLVKLHHRPGEALQDKLAHLVACAPDDPSLDPRRRNFAWPISTVRNAAGMAVGCILPTVPGARSLTALGNPKLRARRAAEMDWHFLHAVAANVAFLFDCLHDQGIVIGDVRPENILIDDRALATLIDCDSVQFTDGDAALHLCPVGSEGFTAPEWIGRRFKEAPRGVEADRFGLAVLLFQLLTGAHPWTGEWMGGGEPPSRDVLIRHGDWPFKPGARLRPIPGMVTPDDLAPGLAALFRRAFIAGIRDPDARPSAAEWHSAVCLALAELETCAAKPHHHHDASISTCPWCARAEVGLPDPFPAPRDMRDSFAPLILAFERALARGDSRMAVELWRENPVLARTEDLKPLASRMAELDTAIETLDRWQAVKSGAAESTGDLAGILDNAVLLHQMDYFRHEAVELTDLSESLQGIEARMLAIPAPPDIATPVPIEEPVQPQDAAAEIAYRIEGGWQGLRPARLILNAKTPCRVPKLALLDSETGRVLLTVQAQRLRGSVSLPFDQPDQKITLDLRTASREDAARIRITAPKKRARTLGGGGATLLAIVPATP